MTFVTATIAAALAILLTQGKTRDALLVVTAFLFGLTFLEETAILLERRPIVTMTNGWVGWSTPHPILGWGPAHPGVFHVKKQAASDGSLIYETDYTIDENLLRQTRSLSSGPATVFFGDSLTFGEGLEDTDTLPQQFAALSREQGRVFNLGFSGYGPQQFLRGVETGFYDKVIGDKPKAFFFLTAPWHAQRTACKASWLAGSPHYRLTAQGIAFDGQCYEGFRRDWHDFLYDTAFYRVFLTPFMERLAHDDVELYIRILSEAVRQSKAKYGVDPIILYQYDSEYYLAGTGFTNQDIVARITEAGAEVVDVTLAKENAQGAALRIPGDGHPTALANHLRAELLVDYLDKQAAIMTE